jgi:hypothetical protein
MSAATCLPASAQRAVMVTSAPAAAKQRAVSTPSPAVPPALKGLGHTPGLAQHQSTGPQHIGQRVRMQPVGGDQLQERSCTTALDVIRKCDGTILTRLPAARGRCICMGCLMTPWTHDGHSAGEIHTLQHLLAS